MRSLTLTGAEDGFTLSEVLVASAVLLILFVMVTASVLTATGSSQNASNQGLALGPAILAEQEAQQLLESAWVPPSANGVTSNCTGNTSGGAFQTTPPQGSFVAATTTSIEVCGVLGSTLKAYTYNMYLTPAGCTASCTFEIDRWPAAGGTPTSVFTVSGLTGNFAPFAFYQANSGAWQKVATSGNCASPPYSCSVASNNLSSIGAVQLTLTGVPSGRNQTAPTTTSTLLPGATLQRMVILSNAGSGDL